MGRRWNRGCYYPILLCGNIHESGGQNKLWEFAIICYQCKSSGLLINHNLRRMFLQNKSGMAITQLSEFTNVFDTVVADLLAEIKALGLPQQAVDYVEQVLLHLWIRISRFLLIMK